MTGEAAPQKPPRIFAMPFARVYPEYVRKAERKGRTQAEVDTLIAWYTRYDAAALAAHLAAGTSNADFFAQAELNPAGSLVTGMICGIRVEAIEDPTMRAIRVLDKLIDELARGRPMERILRNAG